MMEALLLSRLQFAWVIAWHILLPAVTVGLASYARDCLSADPFPLFDDG